MNSENETKQEHDWEALGREAVAAGWEWCQGCEDIAGYVACEYEDEDGYVDARGISMAGRFPDFRDRLTALACIAWVEDVAREVYGEAAACHFGPKYGGGHCVWVGYLTGPWKVVEDAPTGPEACLAAVRAMRGEREGA